MNRIGKLKGKNVLLLQGPMGDFFRRLERVFQSRGATTYKITLNVGDSFFANRKSRVPFRGRPEEWETFISDFLEKKRIDKIFLFGDCRFYQAVTIRIAKERGIEVFVFELGYVRPDYVTMERYGVNDYSRVSRDPEFYRALPEIEVPQPLPAHQSKFRMVYSATMYYFLSNLFRFRYPYYVHHRGFSATRELFVGLLGWGRKGIYALYEKWMKAYEDQMRELSGRYYFVPLQTHNDFQVLQHSNYRSIEKFIIEVLESFAQHAPDGTYLVFKHHPVDRGRKNYTPFIRRQAEILEIEDRVIAFHDVHLPLCLQNARATVTINSTVGLSSIAYGIPTITLGNAIYDIEGLTNKGMKLEEFWTRYQKPDMDLYRKFRAYLIEKTQLNGSFYGRFPVEFEMDEMYSDDGVKVE